MTFLKCLSAILLSAIIALKGVTVTAYCYGTTTASGRKVQPGIIALSRSLEKRYNLKFGDLVHVQGVGLFVFYDRMPYPKWRNHRCDVYLQTKRQAVDFGRKKLAIELIKK